MISAIKTLEATGLRLEGFGCAEAMQWSSPLCLEAHRLENLEAILARIVAGTKAAGRLPYQLSGWSHPQDRLLT